MLKVKVHIGYSVTQLLAAKEIKLRDLATELRVPKHFLTRQLKRPDIGLLAMTELLAHIHMSPDDFLDFCGYYAPGATSGPGAWFSACRISENE